MYPDLPSDSAEKPVTLKTTKAQEVWTYMRPAYNQHSPNNELSFEGMHPNDVLEPTYPFYRPECAQTFQQLPDVKPNALYIFGSKSPFSTPEAIKAKVERTGSGVGGGGKKAEEVVVEGAGHLVAFEKVKEVGGAIVRFVGRELEKWEGENEEFERKWKTRSRSNRAQIDRLWKEKIGPPPMGGKERNEKL